MNNLLFYHISHHLLGVEYKYVLEKRKKKKNEWEEEDTNQYE